MEPPEPVPAVVPLPPIADASPSPLFMPDMAADATTAAAASEDLVFLLWLAGLVVLLLTVVLPALGMPIAVTDWWAALTSKPTAKTLTDDKGEEEVHHSGQAKDVQPSDAAAAMDITGSSLTPAFVDPRRGTISREAMRSSSYGGEAAATREPHSGGGAWSPSALSTAAGGGARTQAGTSGFTGLVVHSGRDAVGRDQPPQRPAFFSWQAK